MKPPLISCIVPVFNGERYLREALDSILAQTYRPLEIIVADDGSTDGTSEVAMSYARRITYVHQTNQGYWAAKNLGLSAAHGTFIAFLDVDDLWHPEKLERQVERFKRRPELQNCVTHVQNFWIPELEEEAARYREHRISKPLPGYVTGTLMARRAVFQRIGTFNAALSHGDGMDWFLLADQSGASSELLPDVLMYRRLHGGNRSRVRATTSREEILRIVKSRLDRKRAVESNS